MNKKLNVVDDLYSLRWERRQRREKRLRKVWRVIEWCITIVVCLAMVAGFYYALLN